MRLSIAQQARTAARCSLGVSLVLGAVIGLASARTAAADDHRKREARQYYGIYACGDTPTKAWLYVKLDPSYSFGGYAEPSGIPRWLKRAPSNYKTSVRDHDVGRFVFHLTNEPANVEAGAALAFLVQWSKTNDANNWNGAFEQSLGCWRARYPEDQLRQFGLTIY